MRRGWRRNWLAGLFLLLAACGGADWGSDQHGRPVAAEQLEGRWLVVNYWAEWCAPCRKEVPELNRLAEQLQGQPVRVLGVNFDALTGEELRRAVESLGIRYTNLTADPAARLGLTASQVLPVTWLIDPEGRVREQLAGEQTAQGLRERLLALGAALPAE
ncbi:TlpA family protein disulfide reductase [Pseudomonas stutzeri]|nr:TlpA family protein disulfide reductase [Stutzerimonas stutzeri]